MSWADDAAVITLAALTDRVALERDWRALEARLGGAPSFFLSWPWIGCWLDHLPAGGRPHVLTARDGEGGAVTALAVLVERTRRRLGLAPRRQWWLHESGDAVLDRVCVEYNGVLATTAGGTVAALDWLAGRTDACDELILGGVDADLAAAITALAPGRRLARVLNRAPCPWLDLAAARRSGSEPPALFGSSTRAALRRCLRLYGGEGAVGLRVAATVDEALETLTILKELHQRDWTGRGLPGAFADPLFERFHRDLIGRAFPLGAIELCRITAGDRVIGALYNFVWRGRVLAYQSGFDRSPGDNRLKPGLLSHSLAIGHALGAGRERYDFMAGEGRHKRDLSTGADDTLVWLALDADTPLNRLEHRLRRWLKRP